jgi:hypothetical protein
VDAGLNRKVLEVFRDELIGTKGLPEFELNAAQESFANLPLNLRLERLGLTRILSFSFNNSVSPKVWKG